MDRLQPTLQIAHRQVTVRDRYTQEPKPVSTLIIVSGFTRPEFLVEMELTAAKNF